jgi:hypothetical protein
LGGVCAHRSKRYVGDTKEGGKNRHYQKNPVKDIDDFMPKINREQKTLEEVKADE